MTHRFLSAGALVLISGLGLVHLLRWKARVRSRIVSASEFAERFINYANSGARNEREYVELTSRVSRMQREMGSYGILDRYKPAGASYMIRNYPLLMNALPEMQQYASDDFLGPRLVPQLATMVRDALIRYESWLKEVDEKAGAELRNPIVWFAEGCRVIVAAPLRMLGSLGIASGAMGRIAESGVVRLIAGIAALLAAVASLVTIATGWDSAKSLLERVLSR